MTTRIAFFLVLALAAAASARAGTPSGEEVIGRMRTARLAGSEDASSLMRVEIASSDGARSTRTLAMYRRQCGDEFRNLVVFRDPPDLSGAAVLTVSRPEGRPDMWMYLPELGRVRQLNAFAQRETFMGSDLTYEDLGAIAIEGRANRVVGEAELDGEPVYKVESRSRPGEAWSRVRSWVSRTSYLPVRIEYFDAAGALARVARFSDVRTVRGIPTPFTIEMQNADTGHRTTLTLLEADYDRKLDCALFRQDHLAHAR
ncbi:MAG TPA: outer membrane lipoprotein-sorting protein [Candidatus Binatia bacterium]|jgi:outer membrane lipoprotein-sorting protein